MVPKAGAVPGGWGLALPQAAGQGPQATTPTVATAYKLRTTGSGNKTCGNRSIAF